MTQIVSGFPGVGKSHAYKQVCEHGLRMLDSDSRTFSWVKEGIRNPEFPDNYMSFIKGNIGRVRCIMVSSHDVVRKALQENGIPYTLVYPSIELQNEYIARYLKRGNTKAFVKLVDEKWHEWIRDIESETFPRLVKLESGQFLSDVVDDILADEQAAI